MAKNASLIGNELLQDRFVQMYMQGLKMVDIAIELGVDKSTTYLWLKREDIKGRIEVYRSEIETAGKNFIKSRYAQYLKNIDTLANQTEDKRTAYSANTYMVDKMDGRATTSISLETTIKEEKLSEEEIDKRLKMLSIEE